MIRLTIPSIEEEDIQAVSEALRSGFLVQGAKVATFERTLAVKAGTKHAVAVSSCTAALHLALLAMGVSAGDIVVLTAYTWPATANVIEMCSATPVFVDINLDTYNIDPGCLDVVLKDLMSNAVTRNKVKAILPVHTFGQMADMPAIMACARKWNLPVVEDAACALGASWEGQLAGSWGVMGCFSFHPRKAITTGEGGAIVTNDEQLDARLRTLRNHGLDVNSEYPDFIMPGLNYRLTEFQAALGITQIAKLERIVNARRFLASRYDQFLPKLGVASPKIVPFVAPVYQSYVALLPPEIKGYRSQIIEELKLRDVETTIGTWHVPLTTYYRNRYGYKRGDFPASDLVFDRSLTLPLHEYLTPESQDKVLEELAKVLGKPDRFSTKKKNA